MGTHRGLVEATRLCRFTSHVGLCLAFKHSVFLLNHCPGGDQQATCVATALGIDIFKSVSKGLSQNGDHT